MIYTILHLNEPVLFFGTDSPQSVSKIINNLTIIINLKKHSAKFSKDLQLILKFGRAQ